MPAPGLSNAVLLALLAAACLTDPRDEPLLDCAEPAAACGLECVDVAYDPAHCGACDRRCAASEVCSAGTCAGGCNDGLVACDRSCRDVSRDIAHCGACDSPCASGFVCAGGACVAHESSRPSDDRRIRVRDEKFDVCGRPIFMNGANTPWNRWDDFGGSYDADWWSGHYADLHDAGVNASRVWITCSGTVGIDIGADGAVLGATAEHWEHLDSFFAIAEERQIYVMATLMSFDHFEDGAAERWKAWIASDANIHSYLENYLLPLLERYGQNPYLWAIDLMNEPDWAYERAGVSMDRLRAYFARAARTIHENGEVLVTVGFASPKYVAGCAGCEPSMSDSQLREALDEPGVYLDFHSPHYYDWVGDVWGNTLYESPGGSNFSVEKPGVIGEFPAHGTAGHSLGEDLEAAFSHGWQGTLPWTSNGVDRNGGFAEVSVAATSFRDRRPARVFPRCP